MKDWDYFDKFEGEINKYMLPCGEGETKASQIVTAVNKLIYKFYNDGDVYDNTHHLKGWANDLSSYANWLYRNVVRSQDILWGIETCLSDDDYSDLIAELADELLDGEFLEKMKNEPKVGSIYNCAGPFKFEENY